MKRLALLLWLTMLAGCHAVYAPAPVGTEVVALNANDWDGTWLTREGSFQIKVTDAAAGKLELAWQEPKDDGFEPRTLKVQIRQSEGWQFASMPDEGDPSRFVWGRVKHEDRQILFWGPDAEKFRAAVQDERIPGTILEGNHIMLGALTDEHMKLITSSDQGLYVNWESPAVFFRYGQ